MIAITILSARKRVARSRTRNCSSSNRDVPFAKSAKFTRQNREARISGRTAVVQPSLLLSVAVCKYICHKTCEDKVSELICGRSSFYFHRREQVAADSTGPARIRANCVPQTQTRRLGCREHVTSPEHDIRNRCAPSRKVYDSLERRAHFHVREELPLFLPSRVVALLPTSRYLNKTFER